MILPTALVIGPMKAGTTWVHDYLAWRGDVCLPYGVKETFFFDHHRNRGVEWYGRHFEHYKPRCHVAVLEVAPSLFHSVAAPQRVADILGPVPLIVTVRDPVLRSWSHYLHLRRKGYTNASLEQAIALYPEIILASRYKKQLERWREALGRSAITVLSLEELIADPSKYAARLCSAVGLTMLAPPDTLGASNQGGVPPSYMLARFGRQAAMAMRSTGAHWLVNLAKRMGLKRVFFGIDGGRRLMMGAEEQALLESLLSGERADSLGLGAEV